MPLEGFTPPEAQAAAPQELELRPAKISDRFIAYVMDAAPFAAAYLAAVYVLVVRQQRFFYEPRTMAALAGACFAAYLLYQLVGHASGGTVGKRLMGLRVVTTLGEPIGLGRGLLRTAGYALSTPFFNLGFILALFHPESRALHDLLAGTLVVEPRPRSAAETGVLFLGAAGLAAGLFGANLYLALTNPTPDDIAAVERAKEGIMVLARIQEAHKEKAGSYTKSLADLARASGDPEQFKSAMAELFDPNRFRVEAGSRAYRITAAAKDRRRTAVTVEGPPPVLK